MAHFHLKHMKSVVFVFTSWPMPPAACSRLYSRDLALAGVFARSGRSSVKSVSCRSYKNLMSLIK